tara:strand:+ start:200 stop:544 length:345 start_codon:yes stop_codon:yes gene_type:complete
MNIRVICKKVPKLVINYNNQYEIINKFYDYNNKLRENVESYKGYIKSESYYNSNLFNYKDTNIDMILTVSEWETNEDMNNWFISNIRNNIFNKYKNIIEKEEIYIIKKEDIFLL